MIFNSPGWIHTDTHAYQFPGQKQFQESRHASGLKTWSVSKDVLVSVSFTDAYLLYAFNPTVLHCCTLRYYVIYYCICNITDICKMSAILIIAHLAIAMWVIH